MTSVNTPKTKLSTETKAVLVKCEELTKNYDERSINVEALKGVNLEVLENEFIAIIGSSGSGKTTLLNLIGGLDKPSSGKIWYDGEDISRLDADERTMFRRKVGIIFQDFNLHSVLTVEQNVELPMIYAEIWDKRTRRTRVSTLLDQVGLRDKRKRLPVELSSGEKQRVGIARAFSTKPKLILADQPTGNLDSKTGDEIIKLMKDLQKKSGITILVVTHNLDVARKADRVIAIEDGMICTVSLDKDKKKSKKKQKQKSAKE